jgi:hypothetical protein
VAITACTHPDGTSRERTPPQPAARIAFEDRRPQSWIEFPMRLDTRQTPGIKETTGHPAALLDADGDGRLDVLLAAPDRVALFRNLGGWRFQSVASAGFRQDGYWQGVAVGDVDNDGRPDLFLSGFGCSALYLNESGCRFRDATAASGLGDAPANRWQTSAAFADVDRDGRLDLYVTCYVELGGRSGVCTYPGGVATACAPVDFAPQRGTLYRNIGAARFVDATHAFGLDAAHGNGLGVAFGDIDDDGFPDLYLANDMLPCDLFVNEKGRRFVNRGVETGTAFQADGSTQAGMGVDFGDYDRDGRIDLVVTNYLREPRSLYHNEGEGGFTNQSQSSRLGPATLAAVGWGVKWADFDNDGLLDLVIANGHPLHRINEMDHSTTARQRLQFFHNTGGGRFEELQSVGSGLDRAIAGRALCSGDIDNDGKIDLLISDIEGQPFLLRNTSRSSSHWLTVTLVSKTVIEGARVTARAGARTWIGQSSTGGSYLSASDGRVYFGLGELGEIDEVQVRWPDGGTTRRKVGRTDRELVIEAPVPRPE